MWTPSAVTMCFLHQHAVDTDQKLRWGQSHEDEAETSRAGPRSEELAREGLGAGTPTLRWVLVTVMTCSLEAKLLRNIPGGWSPLSRHGQQ